MAEGHANVKGRPSVASQWVERGNVREEWASAINAYYQILFASLPCISPIALIPPFCPLLRSPRLRGNEPRSGQGKRGSVVQ